VIRVYRLTAEESLSRAPSRRPELEAEAASTLLRALPRSALSASEAAAIERALDVWSGGDVDITIAAGGGIYRVFPRPSAPRSESRAASVETPRRLAQARGAPICVLGLSPQLGRFVELLEFLGYGARAVKIDGTTPEAVSAALRDIDCAVVVLGAAFEDVPEEPILAACRDRPRAVILLAAARREAGGYDGVISIPVASSHVAETLDAAIALRGVEAAALSQPSAGPPRSR